ncbi:MAG: hypothetical protein WAO19_02735 [Candidatus Kryptoniota bacterium]
MKKQIALIAAAIAMTTCPSFAQMIKPAFGPELAKLSFLVGRFTTQTRITMNANSSNGMGTIKAHWGLDSMFVLFSTEESNPALGSYKGFGVIGYNSQNAQYVLSMFNNFGDRPEYKGNFVGDTLIMSAKIESPQGSVDQQLKWYKDGNNVRLLVFNDMGQGYSLMVDQTAAISADSTMGKGK